VKLLPINIKHSRDLKPQGSKGLKSLEPYTKKSVYLIEKDRVTFDKWFISICLENSADFMHTGQRWTSLFRTGW